MYCWVEASREIVVSHEVNVEQLSCELVARGYTGRHELHLPQPSLPSSASFDRRARTEHHNEENMLVQRK